ncbi:MAG: hypothetical protein HZC55_16265 [Verrucomicrobia bacterium]|nr:hypothetical protein [Verrucomicrobiota bacterium]
MNHALVAGAVLLHVWFWGAGAALLLMPRPWHRFWPVVVVPTGLALQSAVVWWGAKAGWPGTNSYVWLAEAVPGGLLALAWGRHGWRRLRLDVERFGLVWAAMGASLALLALPLMIAGGGLTTVSLGSCDAADYAAGARVLQEFARTDRTGFLGLTEVVRVLSVDNFFDYWIRLNHFTPSALIALHGSVLGCGPHEVTMLVTAVLLAGSLPLVFWVSRAVLGYSGGVSLVLAGIYGVSPIPWYAYAHVAPGQLLAAQAVALLTWAGMALWRGRIGARRGFALAGLLGVGYWLILGSYNFFGIVCLVPVVACVGGLAVWRRAWRRGIEWCGWMLWPLAATGAVFWERVAGLADRLALLQTFDFGWKIPALTAEGWLGLVRGPDLSAWPVPGLRWALSAIFVGLLVWALLRTVGQRRRAGWVPVAFAVPVLAGYLFLQFRGTRLGTNASYDAYKLFAVFYPLLLPALCWWVTLRRSRRLHEWMLVVGAGAGVFVLNLAACGLFIWALAQAPLRVDRELPQLRRVEAMAEVGSVNLIIPDMWSRLWANAFLLRKAQFFESHTYEGRLNTPLRGDWDLSGGIVAVVPPEGGFRGITPRFSLTDVRASGRVRVTLGEGWHGDEFVPGAGERWRWTAQEAGFEVDLPGGAARVLRLTLEARSLGEREISLIGPEGSVAATPVRVGAERGRVSFGPISCPPGRSRWRLRSAEPAQPAGARDPRFVALCVYRMEFTTGGH